MAEVEPQFASDYDDRTTVSVRSVLVEIGQVLGSYQGKFAVIGGAVPWLLLNEADMPHIGTLDVDLTLDAEALGDGEYAQLVESLLRHGYRQREHLRHFQLVRTVPARDGGADRVISTSRRSSATWTISGPPACGSSSTGPKSAPPTNGSRAPLRYAYLVYATGCSSPLPECFGTGFAHLFFNIQHGGSFFETDYTYLNGH